MRIFSNAKAHYGKPAAFLDRDGTLNRNKRGEYIINKRQFKLYKCTIEALKLLSKKGYQIIILSNHSAIGRGYMTLKCAKEINLSLAKKLKAENIAISGIYICPHLPEDGCNCRKPKCGLLEEAAKDTGAKLERSFMAGDGGCDLELAKKAKIRAFLMLTGGGRYSAKKYINAKKFGTLLSLAKYIPSERKDL